MRTSSRGKGPRRVLMFGLTRLGMGLVILALYAFLGAAAPGLAGLLIVLFPALMLYRAVRRPAPGSGWALLITAAVALGILAGQVWSLGLWNIAPVVLAALLVGAVPGIARGATVRPEQSPDGVKLRGLLLPLFLWQSTVVGSQVLATAGLIGLVRLLLLAQGLMAGLVASACLVALIPLAVGRRRLAALRPRGPVVLRRVGMVLLVLVLAVAAAAPERAAPEPGLYVGRLDERMVAQRAGGPERDPVFQEAYAIEGSPAQLRVYPDGTYELAQPVHCRSMISYGTPGDRQGYSRTTYQNTFRSMGRKPLSSYNSFPVEVTVVESIFREPSEAGRRTWGDSGVDNVVEHPSVEASARVAVQPDGSVLLYLPNASPSGPPGPRMPWRLHRVGDVTMAALPVDPADGPPRPVPAGGLDEVLEMFRDLFQMADLSDAARDAGLIAGLLTLLAGASVDMAGLLASAAAANANRPSLPPLRTPGTMMLSGDDARNWLRDRGFIDDDGKFTPAYTQWTDRLYQENPDEQLHLIAYTLQPPDPDAPDVPEHDGSFLPPDATLDIVVRNDPIRPEPVPTPVPQPPPLPVVEPPPVEEAVVEPEPEPQDEPDEPEPPPRNPCIDKVNRLAEIQRLGEALVAENRRLRDQILEIRAEIDAMRVVDATACVVDAISGTITGAATVAGGPLASLPAGLVQNVVAETVKSYVHNLYRDDPSNFWINLASAEAATALATLIGEQIKEAAFARGFEGVVETSVARQLAAPISTRISGLLQVMYSMFGAGRTAGQFRVNRNLLQQRIDNLRKLRARTHDMILEERENKARAEAALNDCLARHGVRAL